MPDFIPYGRQSIDEADIKAVCDTLRSDYLTQGPVVSEFENAMAALSDCKFGVATNSATSALHVACLALGVAAGDYVWTTPNTFIASANCALYCNTSIDFVDIDPITYNLCPEQLERKLIEAKKSNTLPKVIIPVHFAGHPCDMQALARLADTYKFKIIEDASHAVGAKYQEKPVGSQYSDICIFSFHPVKVMTSAEGGMAVTNNPKLAKKMHCLANQGITRAPQDLNEPSPGGWYYEQQSLGFNYRMTELQAALGLSQLNKLHLFIEQRRDLAQNYYKLLRHLPIRLPGEATYASSSWHLFPILLPEALIEKREQVFTALREAGIGTQVHYIPVHTQPYFQKLGFQWGDFPISEDYYFRTLSLPLFPALTLDDQERVVAVLSNAIDKACIG
ncbi:UDP-4-amino-4,6-dideoxy-N-acetyl-beta-L-altrosamine transaminase [Marinomonas balearica]|uniref:UDP-4-amino-4, 6-dideoxy-N-acetyl-beta-L-altrosamine transaminase n=1 Tax=Marinomonas balearica TaxID=491947 RepID=A0A4R6M611_9GAMM|nr:UDP-4-amino-4,6-dideoxy-N-acetyl-beta-L-altrosamine transaminase [Marinomonas balearica]TDO96255.1 UDP-4-amino-4,6-dideoxy-N-acetyl-beta-L-altrosamine transaminase [Marinomonas balearica]